MAKPKFTPWSTLGVMQNKRNLPDYWPESERERIASYDKYDQLYWNDPTQYALRVLEDEQPIYIPNSRIIVDTTAHYLLKGLAINTPTRDKKNEDQKWLTDFLKRERFYSKFATSKKMGIARGDFAFHITADPLKPEGSRVSIEPIHPGMVWKVEDPNDPTNIVKMHIGSIWIDPNDDDQTERMRVLTYEKVLDGETQKISREENVWELTTDWWDEEERELYKNILPLDFLPDEVDQFPVYWFPNIEWGEQNYGSSELRGQEFLAWAVSQGATDTQAALALEGLGVYATDGGRPVDDEGVERDWEIAPGNVAEVPSGSFFRRVEGVGSITPMLDQVHYLEGKMFAATSMTDVALGQVDVAVAQSGIALAIKFMPTLAKIEDRDTAGVEICQQMFFDLKKWFKAYEGKTIDVEYEVSIAKQKLPANRTETINELNNMIDRKIIDREFYRDQMRELGYEIPKNMDDRILKEAKLLAEINALSNPISPAEEDETAGNNQLPPESDPNNGSVDKQPNRSNNRNRSNESGGTESGQTLERQSS